MRLFRQTGVMALLVLAGGCYYYTPLEQPEPQSGAYLQVMLTDSGTSHFWSYLGPDVGDLRGRLVNADDRSLALSVEAVDLRHGQVLSWKGETVSLGREYVAHLEERHLARTRTALLAVGSAAAFIATIKAIQFIGIGNRTGGTPPPPR